jgi:hypothetical protein
LDSFSSYGVGGADEINVADAAADVAMEAAEAMTEVAISITVEEADTREEASSTPTGITSRFDGGCMWKVADVCLVV